MEPIKYICVCFYEKHLGDHGELWDRFYELKPNETIEGLMARLPAERVRVEIREVEPEP